jgi:hypothetical protein
MLDQRLDPAKGDFGVDYAGQLPGFHPHITLPYLQHLLRDKIEAPSPQFRSFIFIRHPIQMLWSYYKYFQPDELCRYNYQQDWSGNSQISFDEWIDHGRVNMDPKWLELAPSFVNPWDLSPLSLEAHVYENDKLNYYNCTVLKLEELQSNLDICSCLLGYSGSSSIAKVNQSMQLEMPSISTENLKRIRTMFPLESAMYQV